jgi:hypothetical protein
MSQKMISEQADTGADLVKIETLGKGRIRAAFQWTKQKNDIAIGLAQGQTQQELATEFGVDARTIRKWLAAPEFSQEVDRLSLMIGIANRAYRLRIAQRVVRQMTQGETIITEKDLLDWLKYVQSETEGIKLHLSSTFIEAVRELAGRGQAGTSSDEAATVEGAILASYRDGGAVRQVIDHATNGVPFTN